MDAETIYATLAKGQGTDIPPEQLGRVADLARKATLSPDTDARLGAARAAASLPPKHSVPVALALSRDPELKVRRLALNAGRAAGPEGQVVVRRMITDKDDQIAAFALDWLAIATDAPAAGACRDLLADPRPAIRGRAAILIGVAGGPGMQIDLRKLLSDPDPGVKAAAQRAIERLAGREPRPEREIWWNRAPVPEDPAQDQPLAPLAVPVPENVPVPETAPAPEPAPVTETVPVPETAPADGPPPLPADLRDRLRGLGDAPPDDRERWLAAIRTAGQPELQAQIGKYRAGADPALGRGLARMVLALDKGAWVTRLQGMLADPDPGVRAAACESVAGLGGLSCVPWLTALLRDGDAAVVASAATGIATMGARLGRPELPRQYLTGLKTDPRPDVRAAAEAALGGPK